MAWDFKLNPGTRDLVPGIVTGPAEVVQRLVTRLKRELGEWFLATEAGLPWYQEGKGILGSKPHVKRDVDLRIRRETLGTEGVERIIKCNTLLHANTRAYSIYMELVIAGSSGAVLFSMDESHQPLKDTESCPLYVRNASTIVFENGKTLQEMYSEGLLDGPQGIEGVQGPQGEKGSDGTFYTFRGTYTPGKTYAVNDLFTHNNNLYLVLKSFVYTPALPATAATNEGVTGATVLLRAATAEDASKLSTGTLDAAHLSGGLIK